MLGALKLYRPLLATAITLVLGGSRSVAVPRNVTAAEPVYDGDPALLWSDTFGTPRSDSAAGIAVGPDGGWVVVGTTRGVLGEASAIGEDAFVRAYAAD